MRTHIKVTQEDIDMGIRFDIYSCPVAYAIRRTLQLDSKKKVSVGVTLADVNGIRLMLPKRVSKFITSFDLDRNSVKPFGFYLNH